MGDVKRTKRGHASRTPFLAAESMQCEPTAPALFDPTYEEMCERIAELERAEDKLSALEEYGVDGWEGYAEAMASLDRED